MFAHVLSDIHLEMHRGKKRGDTISDFVDDNRAEVLFLLGDIGIVFDESYLAFLRSCSSTYEHVFVILGNHEIYGTTVENAVKSVRELVKNTGLSNVVFLNEDTFDLKEIGIRIAGTTLWSHVEDEQRSDIGCFISDFRTILGWSIEANNAAHASCLKWLRREIERARADGVRLVVLTHHAPLPSSCHPKHRGSPLSSAFETDLSRLIEESPHIRYWLHGHTHYSDRRKVGETTVMSNQCGYAGEGVVTMFDRSLRIRLSDSD